MYCCNDRLSPSLQDTCAVTCADQSVVETVSKAATDLANNPATSGAAASAGADVVYSDTLPAQQDKAQAADAAHQATQVCWTRTKACMRFTRKGADPPYARLASVTGGCCRLATPEVSVGTKADPPY